MYSRNCQKLNLLGHFRTDDGLKTTEPEGFVAVDRLKGNAVKLVNRLEFSRANFTAAKKIGRKNDVKVYRPSAKTEGRSQRKENCILIQQNEPAY